MNNRVDYLSDKLVHVRKEIKERQKQYLESRGQTVQSVEPPAPGVHAAEPAGPAEPTATPAAPEVSAPPSPAPEASASPQTLRQDAASRRYEQTMQLRSDLEQRMVRCEARLRHKLEVAEQSAAILSGQNEMLAKSRAALDQLALPAPDAIGPVELGDLYRALDRARLDFFELEATLDAAAANTVPTSGNSASGGAAAPTARQLPTFGEAFRLGLAFSLPLVLGLGLIILASALLLYFSWR